MSGARGAKGFGNQWRGTAIRSASTHDNKILLKAYRYVNRRFACDTHFAKPDTQFLNSLSHLAGGAAGAQKTKRKRQEGSLVEALSGFLQTWQTNNLSQPQTHRESQSRPKWSNLSHSQNGPIDDDQNLIDSLISFLQGCKTKGWSDHKVANELQVQISAWAKPNETPCTSGKRTRWETQGHEEHKTNRNNEFSLPRWQRQRNDWSTATVQGVLACEWAHSVSFVPKQKILSDLYQGKPLTGNVTHAQTHDDYLEIKDAWSATKVHSPMTVLVSEAPANVGGLDVKVTVKRQQGPSKLQDFKLFYLGDLATCPRPCPPITTNIQKFQPQQKVTVRISAPHHYREAFLKPGTWDTARSVLLDIAQWKLAPASIFTGGSWKWTQANKTDILCGHLRVSPDVAKQLCAHSGRRAILITETGVNTRSETIRWFPKPKDQDTENYFRNALAEANKRKQGLRYRAGGGADLGVVQLESDEVKPKDIVIDLHGAPQAWDGTDLTEFFISLNWSNVKVLTRKKVQGRDFKWVVRALPPLDQGDPSRTSWHYVDAASGDLQIHIVKAAPRVPKVQTTYPVKPPRKRFHFDPTEDIDNQGQLPDTQMDPDTDTESTSAAQNGGNKRVRQNIAEQPRERSPRRGYQNREVLIDIDKEEPPGASIGPSQLQPSEVQVAETKGWISIDQKGTGDCGFRSVAAAVHYQNTGQMMSEEESRRQGAALRVQAVAHVRKHQKDFMPFFSPDKDVPPDASANDEIQNMKDWLEAMAQPNTWIEGMTLYALSRKQGMPIVVFWMKDDAWYRTTIAPGFKQGYAVAARKAKPVVLLLQDQHYKWFKPPENHDGKLDMAWLRESAIPKRGDLQGAAKRNPMDSVGSCSESKRAKSSVGTPSVHSLVSQKSQHTVADSVDALASVATPSVHSLVVASGPDTSGQTKKVHTFEHAHVDETGSSNTPAEQVVNLLNQTRTILTRVKAEVTNFGRLQASLLHCGALTRELNEKLTEAEKDTEIDSPVSQPSRSYSQRRLHGKTPWRGSFNVENRRWSCSLCDFQGEVQVKNQIGNLRHQHMSTCHPKDLQISISKTSHAPATKKVIVFEKNLWTCNLCEFRITTNTRNQLGRRRTSHIRACHKDEAEKVQGLIMTLPLVEPSDIPWTQRIWTCACCKKGLGYMTDSQKVRSAQTHLDKCSGLTISENYEQLKNANLKDFQQNHRNKAGWHNVAWRQKRIAETKAQGHEILYVGENETGMQNATRLKYTCRRCKRLQSCTSYFVISACRPRNFPKGRVWMELRSLHPDTLPKVLKAWGWGQCQVLEMQRLADNPAHKPRKEPIVLGCPQKESWFAHLPENGEDHSNQSEDAWQPDLTEQGIEPNPGPREVRINGLCLNTQGSNGAWNCLNQLDPQTVQLVLLQEVNMSERDVSHFCDKACRKGWAAYHVLGAHSTRAGDDSRVGGVVTLVSTNCKSTAWKPNFGEGGHALCAQVGAVTVMNCYARHHEERNTFLQKVFEWTQAQGRMPFLLGGDWNVEPESSNLVRALVSQGANLSYPQDGLGSRWGQKRIIDYLISTTQHEPLVTARPERWSDHRAFEFEWLVHTKGVPDMYEIVPCNIYLPKNMEHEGDWTKLMEIEWKNHQPSWQRLRKKFVRLQEQQSEDVQTEVDGLWTEFNKFLETFLQKSAAKAPFAMRFYGKPHRQKGSEAQFRRINQVTRQPYDQATSNKIRVLRRLWGRLLEFEFRTQHGQQIKSTDNLVVKIRRCKAWTPGLTAKDIEAQVLKLEREEKLNRIQQWRHHLRGSDQNAFRWLRSKPSIRSHAVFNDAAQEKGPLADSVHQALATIAQFWKTVWDRPMDTEMDPQAYFNQWGESQRPEQRWPSVEVSEIVCAALSQKGKAMGTDGWSGAEIALFPISMWHDFMIIFQVFEQRGQFPSIWSELRQSHLPKDGVDPHEIPASKLRPVSILTVWWRIYISARLKTQSAQDWYQSLLQDSQHGGRRKRDCLSALVPLMEANAKGHFIASLDLAQAFDRLTPQRAIATILKFGFPSKLASGISRIWNSQVRVLQWQGQSSPEKQHIRSSLPQGDALSPWALNLVLTTAIKKIQEQWPQSVQVIFIDDRSFASPNLSELLQVWDGWSLHSQQLGFVESLRKTQFFCKTKKGRSELTEHVRTGPFLKDSLEALGVSFSSGGSAPSPKEISRFDKAVKSADRVRALPFNASGKQRFANQVIVGKASFGWIQRAPPVKWCKTLVSRTRRAGYAHQQASVYLCKLLCGHHVDLEFIAGQNAVSALFRYIHRARSLPRDWTLAGGVSRRVKLFLKKLDWIVQVPFRWHHAALHVVIDFRRAFLGANCDEILHHIRESWRRKQWMFFTQQNRRDSQRLRLEEYDATRCCVARLRASLGNIHEVACLTGAFVSPLRYSVMTRGRSDGRCPFCHHPHGSKEHVVWNCPARFQVPEKPDNLLEFELGWPLSRNLTAVIQHMAKVRAEVLRTRYD